MYSKQRLEMLSDGIFAITMTLLVLELKVPPSAAPSHLWEALREDRIGWLSFAITFMTAARYWMLQHRVFELAEHFGHQATTLTFLFLGLISILPFSTALVGRYGSSDSAAIILYTTHLCCIGLALIAKLEYLRHASHATPQPAVNNLRYDLYSLTTVMGATALATLVLPANYIFIAPAALILASNWLRRRTTRPATA